MGNIDSTGTLAWDGLSFSCDDSFVIDEGMNEEQSRRIQVQGRIADDLASLKEMGDRESPGRLADREQ